MAFTQIATTLSDVKDFAKSLLDEGGDLFWSDALQTKLANEANRMVFRILVDTNPEFFLNTTGPITVASDSESVQLNSASVLGTANVPYKIVGIEDTPNSAAVGQNNLPRKWHTMRFADRYQIQRLNGSVYGASVYHYVVVKNFIYISPIPNEALNVFIHWIGPLQDMSSASDPVLSQDGTLSFVAEQFGDCVAYALAHLMNAKQNAANPAVEQMWQEAMVRMQDHAVLRNVDEPMSVRVTRGPWE